MAAVARNVIPYPDRGVFEVYPADAADQAHILAASSAEEAAARFLEGWHPAVESGEGTEITVVDRRTGAATRLLIDIE